MRNRFGGLKIVVVSAAAAAVLSLAVEPTAAQAPRTADGEPNFNGIWQALGTAHWDIEGHAAERDLALVLPAAHPRPIDRHPLAVDEAEAGLAAPAVGLAGGVGLGAFPNQLLDLVFHDGFDEHLADTAQQIAEALLHQRGDVGGGEAQLDGFLARGRPRLKPFDGSLFSDLISFLHATLLVKGLGFSEPSTAPGRVALSTIFRTSSFVVDSEEGKQYEQAQRERAMEAVRAELEALGQRVGAGKLKAPEKVGAAAARILSRRHGQRYFDCEYQSGSFRYFEHPLNFEREKALEGKYLIQTEEPNLTAVEAVTRYKELMEVERAFRDLKDVIQMRPIFHQARRGG